MAADSGDFVDDGNIAGEDSTVNKGGTIENGVILNGDSSSLTAVEEETTVTVILPTFCKETVQISLESTVEELKRAIKEIWMRPVERQLLTFEGRFMQNDRTLASYGIKNKDSILLSYQPEAGTNGGSASGREVLFGPMHYIEHDLDGCQETKGTQATKNSIIKAGTSNPDPLPNPVGPTSKFEPDELIELLEFEPAKYDPVDVALLPPRYPNFWDYVAAQRQKVPGAMLGYSSQGSATAPRNAKGEPYEVLYKDQLADLREMGFFKFKRNLQALIATEGNLHAARKLVLELERQEREYVSERQLVVVAGRPETKPGFQYIPKDPSASSTDPKNPDGVLYKEIYANQLSHLSALGFYGFRRNLQALIETEGDMEAAVELLLKPDEEK